MPNILIATFGSLGDLHPCLMLGQGLQARGHHVTLATDPFYRARVEATGLAFAPIRPALNFDDEALQRRVLDPRWGSKVIINDIFMPAIVETYTDILPYMQAADLYINAPLTAGGMLAAEVTKTPWVGTVLTPMSLMSTTDPPTITAFPYPNWVHQLPHAFKVPLFQGLYRGFDAVSQPWLKPYHRLRQSLGLPAKANPLFAGQFSPWLNLALLSPVLAPPQPDWPQSKQGSLEATGFLYTDSPHWADEHPESAARLAAFLAAGPPPIVFTLGSSAVNCPGAFYQTSATVCQRLGERGILLAGRHASALSEQFAARNNLLVMDYAPHALVFPQAAVVVHQGGVGTTAQALRAGVPQLVVPFGFDQPDNARRVVGLGVGETLGPRQYSVRNAEQCLQRLLSESSYQYRAKLVAQDIAQEDGLTAACNKVEALLARV